ncbi:MAG: hypothetical protein AAFX94_09365, partial [Myxococcota bacterium]
MRTALDQNPAFRGSDAGPESSAILPHNMSDVLRAIAHAQKKILSFDRFETTDAWIGEVGAALARVMRTDHAYFIDPRPAVDPSADDTLEVCAPTLGDDFAAGILDDFRGFAPSGHSIFSEQYSTLLHAAVHGAGPTAVHDAPLFDESARKELRLQAEVFDQAEIIRQLALSVPQRYGESLLVFGYDESSVPEWESDAHYALQLLLPTFVHSLELRSRWKALGDELAAFELVPAPTCLVDDHSLWANRALRELPLAAGIAEELQAECLRLARALLKSSDTDCHGTTYAIHFSTGPDEL